MTEYQRFPALHRRQADINRRLRAVQAVMAYSKATPELLVMAWDELVRLDADNNGVAIDRLDEEWAEMPESVS